LWGGGRGTGSSAKGEPPISALILHSEGEDGDEMIADDVGSTGTSEWFFIAAQGETLLEEEEDEEWEGVEEDVGANLYVSEARVCPVPL